MPIKRENPGNARNESTQAPSGKEPDIPATWSGGNKYKNSRKKTHQRVWTQTTTGVVVGNPGGDVRCCLQLPLIQRVPQQRD